MHVSPIPDPTSDPAAAIFHSGSRTGRALSSSLYLQDVCRTVRIRSEVECALKPQEQPIIAVARQIYRLLVDQYGIDNAAHLYQLLPVAAIASEARDLPGGNRTDLAEADFRPHPLEAGAHDAAGGGAAEVVVDYVDLRPAKSHKTLAHRVLQPSALAIVQDL